jgi:hypothetical protein
VQYMRRCSVLRDGKIKNAGEKRGGQGWSEGCAPAGNNGSDVDRNHVLDCRCH